MPNWDEAAVVVVELPACPHCYSLDYIPIRGKKDPDGGRTSKRVCAKCRRHYIVLALPPDSGKDRQAIL